MPEKEIYGSIPQASSAQCCLYICFGTMCCGAICLSMLINVYYTIMSIYGWVLWARNAQDNIITISRTTPADWKTATLLGAFSFLFVIGVYYLKPFIKNDFSMQGVTLGFHNFLPTEYVDVFTTAIFLVGMWLMAKRKIENWLFWIVGDLISIPLYYIKGMVFTSFQYLLFTIIAIMGYLEWRRKLQQELMSLSK